MQQLTFHSRYAPDILRSFLMYVGLPISLPKADIAETSDPKS